MATNSVGQTDQVLNTGRIAYGKSGANFYPLQVEGTSGALSLGASTAAVGDVDVRVVTTSSDLLSPQLVAASSQVKSTAYDVSTLKYVTLFIDHGRAATAVFGTNGTEYRVDFTNSTGRPWRSVASVVCSSAACNSIMTGTALAVGATIIAVVSTTTMAVGDKFVFANTTSAASIEWAQVVRVNGTADVGILDGLQYVQASTQVMYNGAEHFVLNLNTEAAQQMRVVVNNNASGTTNAIYTHVGLITSQ